MNPPLSSFLLCGILLLCPPSGAAAQQPQPYAGSRWPISAAGGNHAVGLPGFRSLAKGPFPVGVLAASCRLNGSQRHQWWGSAGLGAYSHKGLLWATFVRPELHYAFNVAGWHAGLAIGVAYLHHGTATREYRLVNGAYRRAGQWGHPAALATLAFVAGWGPRAQTWGLTLRYDAAFHLFYATAIGIPVLPNHWATVGVWVRI
jgi:hypothetical protein